MTVPLTSPGYTDNSLAARMSKHVEGQITWPDFAVTARCAACRFYADNVVTQGKNKGHGRCKLVKAHTKKDGKPFDGSQAYACGKYEAGQ